MQFSDDQGHILLSKRTPDDGQITETHKAITLQQISITGNKYCN
jgi:hypothetical protein